MCGSAFLVSQLFWHGGGCFSARRTFLLQTNAFPLLFPLAPFVKFFSSAPTSSSRPIKFLLFLNFSTTHHGETQRHANPHAERGARGHRAGAGLRSVHSARPPRRTHCRRSSYRDANNPQLVPNFATAPHARIDAESAAHCRRSSGVELPPGPLACPRRLQVAVPQAARSGAHWFRAFPMGHESPPCSESGVFTAAFHS